MEVFDAKDVHKLEEHSTLLTKQMSRRSEWMKRYRNSSKCITSKAGLISLVWSFAAGTIYGMAYNPSNFIFNPFFEVMIYAYVGLGTFIGSAIISCFYPLAGFLADNKIGRYKTIIRSLQLLFGCFLIGIITCVPLLFLLYFIDEAFYALYGIIVTLALIFLPMTVGFVGFNANIIQFGMDQLHDSPMDHQSLFIHWYVCVYYSAEFISRLPWEFFQISTYTVAAVLLSFILIVMLLLCTVFLIIAHRNRHWFLVDPARVNPYKLVYEITKFARRHKVPLNRSAFTYWEEELPTGLDLGKAKYGGPFTTEQVEAVKAFYGILKILFALGPVFFLSFALDPTLYWNILPTNTTYGQQKFGTLLTQNFFHSLVVVVILLVYLIIIRPFRIFAIPKMLKRIGIGIIFFIVSLVCAFGLTTAIYHQNGIENCIGSNEISNKTHLWHNIGIFFVQSCCLPLSNILIYTALYEFICAQSPHSMKGLLIGLSFTIKGFFQALAAVMVIFFNFIDFHSLNCDTWYYMINIILGLVIFTVYVLVARRYKYRQREDFCDIYRFAEEFYSKTN